MSTCVWYLLGGPSARLKSGKFQQLAVRCNPLPIVSSRMLLCWGEVQLVTLHFLPLPGVAVPAPVYGVFWIG